MKKQEYHIITAHTGIQRKLPEQLKRMLRRALAGANAPKDQYHLLVNKVEQANKIPSMSISRGPDGTVMLSATCSRQNTWAKYTGVLTFKKGADIVQIVQALRTAVQALNDTKWQTKKTEDQATRNSGIGQARGLGMLLEYTPKSEKPRAPAALSAQQQERNKRCQEYLERIESLRRQFEAALRELEADHLRETSRFRNLLKGCHANDSPLCQENSVSDAIRNASEGVTGVLTSLKETLDDKKSLIRRELRDLDHLAAVLRTVISHRSFDEVLTTATLKQ